VAKRDEVFNNITWLYKVASRAWRQYLPRHSLPRMGENQLQKNLKRKLKKGKI
jgi:hypothetical protein